MDFELNEDQEALAEGVAVLCEGRFDIETVRLMATDGLDRGRWTELAQTGVFSLTRPEADGGLGMGWAEAVVVFEQLGRALVPGPLVATTLTAALVGLADTTTIVETSGLDATEIGEGAAEGSIVVGALQRCDGPCFVEFAGWVDGLVISDDEGLWWVEAEWLKAANAARAAHPLDPLTPVSVVSELPQGRRIADRNTAIIWRQCGALLTSALQLGIAAGATDLAVEYAKQREQFGKPIGAFQAVKHRCADMITRVEVLRAAVYAAAVTVDGKGVDDPSRCVAVAKVLASSAAAACGKDAVQVHGGMGYTWEVDAHLYLKRAWVHDLAFGDGDEYAEQLAGGLLSG
ncbi:MAG: acyl-CoA/acyl-ACP dehydrogenase [Acidimicrobiaceae bacterium]|nr:acyl-CoA/acyl-ACP dehydrogenase [Acidimicrobiaceae bacterium]